jgi:hypothetical protein
MAEQLSLEEVYGKCIYWTAAKHNAEVALKTAEEQLAIFLGLLAVGEAENAS